MYRAVTWAVLREGVDPQDAGAVADLAARTSVTVTTDPDDQHVTVDGHPVDREIRSQAVTTAVSPVSAVPAVRALLVAAQRVLIGPGAVVVEGRDIGTVVAPGAKVKVYLQADPTIRASRRQAERPDIGADALATDLRIRDASDRERMQPAEDAELIDTTNLEVDDVVGRIEALVRSRSVAAQ
jgi:cytidylate kinase